MIISSKTNNLDYPNSTDYYIGMSEEDCIMAVSANPFRLQYIERQTPEICLAAVKQNGMAFFHVKDQTPEICLAAVQNEWLALEWVEDQTEEMCLEAIKQSGYAIQYVKNQTLAMCMSAVKETGTSLSLCNILTDDLVLSALGTYDFSIYYDTYHYNFLDLIIKDSDSFLLSELKKSFGEDWDMNSLMSGNNSNINLFKLDPLKYCAGILSNQNLDYVIDLKNKIPDIFEQNDYLKSTYEKMLLKDIAGQNMVNNNNVKIKKI